MKVVDCKTIKDAYAEFMTAYHDHRIDVKYYENWLLEQLEGISKMVQSENEQPNISSDYKYFLENKFS